MQIRTNLLISLLDDFLLFSPSLIIHEFLIIAKSNAKNCKGLFMVYYSCCLYVLFYLHIQSYKPAYYCSTLIQIPQESFWVQLGQSWLAHDQLHYQQQYHPSVNDWYAASV